MASERIGHLIRLIKDGETSSAHLADLIPSERILVSASISREAVLLWDALVIRNDIDLLIRALDAAGHTKTLHFVLSRAAYYNRANLFRTLLGRCQKMTSAISDALHVAATRGFVDILLVAMEDGVPADVLAGNLNNLLLDMDIGHCGPSQWPTYHAVLMFYLEHNLLDTEVFQSMMAAARRCQFHERIATECMAHVGFHTVITSADLRDRHLRAVDADSSCRLPKLGPWSLWWVYNPLRTWSLADYSVDDLAEWMVVLALRVLPAEDCVDVQEKLWQLVDEILAMNPRVVMRPLLSRRAVDDDQFPLLYHFVRSGNYALVLRCWPHLEACARTEPEPEREPDRVAPTGCCGMRMWAALYFGRLHDAAAAADDDQAAWDKARRLQRRHHNNNPAAILPLFPSSARGWLQLLRRHPGVVLALACAQQQHNSAAAVNEDIAALCARSLLSVVSGASFSEIVCVGPWEQSFTEVCDQLLVWVLGEAQHVHLVEQVYAGIEQAVQQVQRRNRFKDYTRQMEDILVAGRRLIWTTTRRKQSVLPRLQFFETRLRSLSPERYRKEFLGEDGQREFIGELMHFIRPYRVDWPTFQYFVCRERLGEDADRLADKTRQGLLQWMGYCVGLCDSLDVEEQAVEMETFWEIFHYAMETNCSAKMIVHAMGPPNLIRIMQFPMQKNLVRWLREVYYAASEQPDSRDQQSLYTAFVSACAAGNLAAVEVVITTVLEKEGAGAVLSLLEGRDGQVYDAFVAADVYGHREVMRCLQEWRAQARAMVNINTR